MKSPLPIYLAVEDDISEWTLRRLLRERPIEYAIGPVFKERGFGALKRQSPAFNNMAKACPVLLLTDLDQQRCAPELLSNWLNQAKHPNFLLRVAVREVEAWLLASDVSLGRFLGIRKGLNISDPECLTDPKIELLKLAEGSPRRELRDAMVRRDSGGNLRQGPAYNSTLWGFVDRNWNIEVASSKCPSLRRTLTALERLESNWNRRTA